ncbi:hypothetical protein ARAM_003376 [Aspergillus rambellii]|uniref:Endonuclease/exonuclease/phosphatase domain-containing protein n=1 Tax=Aspergillus rambellii TaxID=308745 RepID=A0A0F8UJP9_9EURO|nr:hypothetical protein ARAM_003376 [Aspergillus rambellii]
MSSPQSFLSRMQDISSVRKSQAAPVLDTALIQPFYSYNHDPGRQEWQPARSSSNSSVSHGESQQVAAGVLRLITWNIDFQIPAANERMSAALQYLAQLLYNNPDQNHDIPTVIFFQEMVLSDIELIKDTRWIREGFYVTDTSGSATLVINVHQTQPIQAPAKSSVYAILILKALCLSRQSGQSNSKSRPSEEEAVVLPTPHAALLAGDLNAFAPEDGTAPTECGLQDVFLKLGGQEGTEEAFTWGQQVPRYIKKKFGCSRMDKVLFCGGIEPLRLQKIGEGVKAWVQYPEQSDEDSTDSTDDGEEVWATDHIGLCAELKIL